MGTTNKIISNVEEESHYRSLIEQTSDTICIVDASLSFIEVNPSGCRMLGYSKEEVLQLFLEDVLFEEDLVTNPLQIDEIRSGKLVINERRIKRKDGTAIEVELSGKLMEGGRMMFFGRDITERKRAEKELQAAYIEKNNILESITDGFFAVDKNSIVTYWNKRAEILLNAKREDVIGKNLHEMFVTPGSMAFYDNYQKAIRDNETVHFEEFSQRSNRWFAVSAFASANGMSVYFKDVTDKKIAQEKIKESELRYRSLVEQATDAICITDASMKIIEINPCASKMLGYSKEEFLNLTIADLFVTDDLKNNPFKLEELRSGKVVSNERRFKRKDGTLLETEINAKILEDGRYVVFARDITERKKAEDEIKKLSVIARETVNAVVITDPEGRIVWVNEAFTRITEFNIEEVLGKKPGDLLQGEETNPDAIRFMRAEIKKSEPFECDIINYSRSGRKYWVRIQCQPQFDESGKLMHYFAIETDITDKVYLELELENERRLKQLEITEAVITAQENERQQLGSELHDNILQILAGSRLYLGLAEKELKLEYPYLKQTDSLINAAITEIRNLSHALIPPSLNESELIGAIESIIKITQQTSGIEINLEVSEFDETYLSDKLKLCIYRIIQEQFNNILKHATARHIIVRLIQDNEKTLLNIKDDGVGFDTCKKAAGVGLLNIKTRASLFNGELIIISSPGNGCELRVLFN